MSEFLTWLQEHAKCWTKPAIPALTSGLFSDLTRSRADLVVENAILRQQLIVLNRQVKRPKVIDLDRFCLVFLSHFTRSRNKPYISVQPDTLLRWHRELFQFYWRQKSKGKPKIFAETIALIEKMVKENRFWGAGRIRGELLKLGIEVSKRSTQKYMSKESKSTYSSNIVPMPLRESWATLLKNQASIMLLLSISSAACTTSTIC